jgi:heptosyltransferase-2
VSGRATRREARAAALAERLARRPPRAIVVVQTAFLGDVVFTSALVRSLRARFPAARLDLCVTPRARDVALAIPGVSSAVVFDKRGADAGARGLLRASRRLRERGYDLAVLPHRSLRSALLAWLAGVPERVGFAGTAGSAFASALAPDEGGAFVEREAGLARVLGATPAAMLLEPRAEWIAALPALPGAARLAALCLGSEWETKIWPARHVAGLARALRASGRVPVLLGGPRERALAAEVLALAPEAGCLDTTGNSVAAALALLSRCALCVGGDTGLVHAARALGVPTVAVFGPTTPSAHAFGPRERAVSLGLACSPCSAHGSRRCPLGHHDCLQKLEPRPVLEACAALERA